MAPKMKKRKTMDNKSRNIIHMILQFLQEENYDDSLHTLEKESGVFFHMRYFEDKVTNGDLDEAEKYLSGFTNMVDNIYSKKMFFWLRRQKFREALDRKDEAKAHEILTNDLKFFTDKSEKLFKCFAMLLSTATRESKLTKHVDAKSTRAHTLREVKQLIVENPVLQDKLLFPNFRNSRLRTLVEQGLKVEQQIFNNPKPDLRTKNLFVDCNFGQISVARAPYSITNNLAGSIPIARNSLPIGAHELRAPYSITKNLAGSIPIVRNFLPVGAHENGGSQTQPDVNVDIERDVWKPTEISTPFELCSLRLPDSLSAARIMKLMYTNSGSALLALSNNAVHKLWKWNLDQPNFTGKASAKVKPLLWTPSSGSLMTNETSGANPEEASPCFVFSKNNSYVISASGGKISLHNMSTFKTTSTFKTPPPAATSIAIHPKDNNVIAIGMDDSTIQIYNVPIDKLICKLEAHQKKVTGLAFSSVMDILVSSDANSMLCAWGLHKWSFRASTFMQTPAGGAPNFNTRVQFHKDQSSVLAVHKTKVAVYEAPKMDVLKQWFPPKGSMISAITDATYSSDSESVFVSLDDGRIAVLISKTLKLRCLINPSAYLPSDLSTRVYPVAIAAHPSETNQFALGLTDGGVYILEPLASKADENDHVDANGLSLLLKL